MKRSLTILAFVALGLILAACSSGGSNGPNINGVWVDNQATGNNCGTISTGTVSMNIMEDSDGIVSGSFTVYGGGSQTVMPIDATFGSNHLKGDAFNQNDIWDFDLLLANGTFTGNLTDEFSSCTSGSGKFIISVNLTRQ